MPVAVIRIKNLNISIDLHIIGGDLKSFILAKLHLCCLNLYLLTGFYSLICPILGILAMQFLLK